MSEGDRLSQKASALLSSASGFSLFGSKTDKLEQAADTLKDAANAYRASRDMLKAGKTFEQVS